ncbi:hypothetical protein [Tumebacillus avium]|uniref:hypothetical protein n=1 Tax=Tumebacillus avium TaxID=1903704 RepID=UPI0012FE4042|nr:hypothetical protein [Tumebacillus avium]
MEAGTLIIERARVPYLVGCVLPSDVIRHKQVKSQLHLLPGRDALELQLQIDANGQQHHLQFQLPYAKHRDFLHSLSDASTLYFLNGSDHPTSRTMCNRIYQSGFAIELTDHHKKTSLPN